jgi:predicted type IV restriction endonuclease
MRIQSPLSNLCEVLKQVTDSAKRYQTTLKKNEAATRAVLIDPVLRALGWDTANTYMVEVEKSLTSTRVDYALYDNNTDVKIVIEAKSLGTNLQQNDITMNLITYAFTYGIQEIFLTDGLIWQHFTSFQPGNISTKTIDLTSDSPVDCASYLVQRLDAAKFWPEEQTIDALAQQINQLENTIANLQKDFMYLKNERPSSKSNNKIIFNSNHPENDLNYIPLDQVQGIKGKKPTHLLLPDNSQIRIKGWSDVLRECCKFALQNNPDIPIPLPDKSGKKIQLFSTVRPAPGISYIEEQYYDQQIYIYTNYDAIHCVANALYVLALVPSNKQQAKASVVINN